MTTPKPTELSMAPSIDTIPADYDQSSGKTMRKIKENPMVPLGMAGFFLAAAYGFRNFKNRPKNMTASMYIMRFRVFAQSIAVGAMGLGIGASIIKHHFGGSEDVTPAKEKRTK